MRINYVCPCEYCQTARATLHKTLAIWRNTVYGSREDRFRDHDKIWNSFRESLCREESDAAL